MRILSIGEVLWDLFPDAEHLGGAPLNLAFHATRLGHSVAILSAVGSDRRGESIFEFAKSAGIQTDFIQTIPHSATGVVEVRFDPSGEPRYQLKRPAAYDLICLQQADALKVAAWKPDWICFGTLFHTSAKALQSTLKVFAACPEAKRFYDINLRPGEYDADLVRLLAPHADILKLNLHEAYELKEIFDTNGDGLESFTKQMMQRFGYLAVCVTLGQGGCAIRTRDGYGECPTTPIEVVDTVGAGDAFSAAFLHSWNLGMSLIDIGEFANRVGGVVASRKSGTPAWTIEEAAR